MDLSDEEIITRVQQGEREEYVVIFDRYYSRVERYARRQLQNAETARDLASETFLRAYRNVDSFRTGENISYLGYLLLICRRLILTERGRQRNGAVRSLEENTLEAERLADSSPLPIMALLDNERRAMLQRALESLSTDDREIIHLAFERDLSRRDIVSILGKPSISAVTSHLHRAMQKLKEIVARQGYFETEYRTGRN